MTAPNKNGEYSDESTANEKIELDEQTYSSLLERLQELEEREEQSSRKEPKEPKSIIDELADEAKKESEIPEVEIPDNIDSMTNSQLLNFVVEVINRQASPRLRDMELKVETMRVLREIDKAELKYDDFWRYEGKIRELSTANPSLNIEQAYKLAKADDPNAGKHSEEGDKQLKRTRTEKLLNLPQRKTFGEKPGVSGASFHAVNRGTSTNDAAERAWEEVVGKGKTEI